MPRRVVTGHVNGRSRVLSDEILEFEDFAVPLWDIAVDGVPSWVGPFNVDEALPIEPGRGESKAMLIKLTPESVRSQRENPMPGIRENGFHTTRTVDYIVILDGVIILDLDEESVELHRGDVVIQQATSHAWSTRGEESGTFLVVITTLDALL